MWPVTIFLMGVVLWLWLAFMLTVWFAFNALCSLIQGHFIRAAIWGCLSAAGWFWWHQENWFPDPYQFDRWLKGSAWVVGFAAFLTFIRFCHRLRHQQAAQTDTPSLNINVKFSPSWDMGDCEVHERRDPGHDLVTVNQVGRRRPRRAIGTKQSPRRLPGPTIIDQ